MKHTEVSSFGSEAQQRRESLGLSREMLAGKVGCAAVTIYKIEINERRPSVQIAELLARHLNVPAEGIEAFVKRARQPSSISEPETAQPNSAALSSLSSLPASLIALMGRDEELGYLSQLLIKSEARLVTLTGSPGVGKTQLALAVARAISRRNHYKEGCVLVPLAALGRVEDIPAAILIALGETPAVEAVENIWQALQQHLALKNVLLVLDNFEHLVAAAQPLAELLRACPALTLLVTSQIRLRINGEREYPVKPLAHEVSLQLFVARAQAVQPYFELNASNQPDIVAICKRLDGLPLAIELAAARIKLLSPAALLARLTGRLALLTEGAADAPERHQTLRNAIAWSYDLLSAEEQRVFDCLGVFAESWSLLAIQHIAQLNEESTYRLMSALIDHSLITPIDTENDEPRFTLLESLRDYARERLRISAQRDEVYANHAAYFRQFALDIEEPLRRGDNDAHWLAQLEREHDNLRNALNWLLTHEQPEAAAETGHALWVFWCMRGHAREGLGWMERVLAHMPPTTQTQQRALAHAKALRAAGNLCYQLFDLDRAVHFLEESLTAARLAEDSHMLNLALSNLATAAYSRGDTARAKALVLESLQVDSESNDERSLASSWMTLGEIALAERQYDEAITYSRQALAVWRRTGERHNIAIVLTNMGIAQQRNDDLAAASSCQQEALVLARELGDRQLECVVLNNFTDLYLHRNDVPGAQANCLQALRLAQEIDSVQNMAIQFDSLALCEFRLNQTVRAVTLLGASDGIRDSHQVTLTEDERAARAVATADLYALLKGNTPQLEYAYTRGKVLTLNQAVAFAMAEVAAQSTNFTV